MSGLLGGEVPLDRVVAVVADLTGLPNLPTGGIRWGSGFLLTDDLVLTAWHCTVDRPEVPEHRRELLSGRLKVLRHTPNGWESAEAKRLAYSFGIGSNPQEWGLDVAVLSVDRPPWGHHPEWSAPRGARVDRHRSGPLVDCVAVGYPMYMLDAAMQRDTAEVRGVIRQADNAVSGYLTLDDDQRSSVQVPPGVSSAQTRRGSPWGGLSGAAVFHRGRLLGHVVQHRPHMGGGLTVIPVARIADAMPGSRARRVADLMGLPATAEELEVALGVEQAIWSEALQYGSLGADGRPRPVCEVDDLTVFGVRRADADPRLVADLGYVSRRKVDQALSSALREAVLTHRLVLVVGDSAAGKSRCAAEAVRSEPALAQRPLLVPQSHGVQRLLDSGVVIDDTVVWLDDLARHLSTGLSADLLRRLLGDYPSALCIATIRREQMAGLQRAGGQLWEILTDSARVTRVDVPAAWSSDDQSEVARRIEAPDLQAALSDGVGLGEWLIAGPELMAKLRLGDAIEKAVAHAVVGWERIGLHLPLPTDAAALLWADYLSATDKARVEALDEPDRADYFDRAVRWLCTPVLGRQLHEQQLAYQYAGGFLAHDYVADQVGRDPGRPKISERTWDHALAIAYEKAGDGGVEACLAIGRAAQADDALGPASTAYGVLHKIDYPMAGPMLAGVLHEHRLYRQAIEVCEQVVERLEGDPDWWSRLSVAWALSVEAAALWQLNERDAALTAWDRIVEAYGADPTPQMRARTAAALLHKCQALAEPGSEDWAVAVADELDRAVAQQHAFIEGFGPGDDPKLRATVAMGACALGLALAKRAQRRPDAVDDSRRAITVLGVVISRFGDDPAEDVREQVAKAMYSRAIVLRDCHQRSESAAAFQATFDRFRSDPRPAIRAFAAWSAYALAVERYRVGQLGIAAAILDEWKVFFGEDPAAELVEVGSKVGELGAEILRLSPDADPTSPGSGSPDDMGAARLE